jgi:Cd2+/Zn2+-exporting ATPase
MATRWGAIAADVGVSLLVVMNALRLLRARDDRPAEPPRGGEALGDRMAVGALTHGH